MPIDDLEDLHAAVDPATARVLRTGVRRRAHREATKDDAPRIGADEAGDAAEIADVPGTARIYLKTYGCSHNSSDSEVMAGQLQQFGYRLVGEADREVADLWLINSCTVKNPSQEHMATDLKRGRALGKALVVAGPRQPAITHAVAAAINAKLGAYGSTVETSALEGETCAAGIAKAVSLLNAGSVDTLVVMGANPVADAPADLGFAAAMAKARHAVHLGYRADETARAKGCTWHVPMTHFLESWGDTRAADGTVALTQPLMAPNLDPADGGRSALELCAALAGDDVRSGLELVRRTHMARTGKSGAEFERAFRTELDRGTCEGTARARQGTPEPNLAAKAMAAWVEAPRAADGMELAFFADGKVFDGRLGNVGWLQELPDPVTKITWDNALLMSAATAAKLGVKSGDMVDVGVGAASAAAAAWVVPGMADEVLGLAVGYGRGAEAGTIAAGAGFAAAPLRTAAAFTLATGVKASKGTGTYAFAHTQDHGTADAVVAEIPMGSIQERLPTLVREASLAHYKEHPDFAKHATHVAHRLSMWEETNLDGARHRWAMTIDLSACTGCSACVVACQAENNIPIVGKDQVARGREMHWIRIDRYFKGGDASRPDAYRVQPVTCVHCENAPCEQVCPVAATVHDQDGLNNMVYNRCIGTRYCSNNCPYKVRRFNFFDYQRRDPIREQTTPLQVQPDYYVETGPDEWLRMQFNPEVTVRMRGVMEKCTFCVQRIAQAKIKYKNEWVKAGGTASGKPNFSIPDGAIQTACQQACPAGAIVFGDLNDPKSQVAKLHASKVSYGMLEELNVKPRLKYLARVSNPGVDHGAHDHGHDHGHGSDAGHGGHASNTPKNGAHS